MSSGPAYTLELVLDAIESVVTTPLDHNNMCALKTNKRARTVKIDHTNIEHHKAVRYSIYQVVRRKLDYNGPRVPLPALAEIFVKVVVPGPNDEPLTWFQPSARRNDSQATVAEDFNNC
jgi:hypothetical protein